MFSAAVGAKVPLRDDSRVILHFDYDCFYASVFEASNPSLKSRPLAVQQKQIVVTCNYEARRRGLRKLQLIKDARKVCPDLIVVLGEDLTRFRDASKDLHAFLKGAVWGDRVEKLGFDEVFLDVTSMIDYNIDLLNHNDLANSFFQLSKSDPTAGFPYDASTVCGPTYPAPAPSPTTNNQATVSEPPGNNAPSRTGGGFDENYSLHLRLILGSHLAHHLRTQLEERKGYTSTVGISTSKLLSKLVGNVHKPRNQTTLVPPYHVEQHVDISSNDDGSEGARESNVTRFLDVHEIRKVPGIGSKMALRIRAHILGREGVVDVHQELPPEDAVTVKDVRKFPGMGPALLGEILSGGGWPRDTGARVWGLLNGVDPTPVAEGRSVPTQISIEDSYGQLDSLEGVKRELVMLARSLIRRMHTDLTGDADSDDDVEDAGTERQRRWLAHPRTFRLSTRAKPPPNPDGSRSYYGNRVSRSCPMPTFIFSFNESVNALADRLVHEIALPMFCKLHPDGSGWKLNLINLAATNMADSAGAEKTSAGRDIGKMFRNQERVLREWRVEDKDVPPEGVAAPNNEGGDVGQEGDDNGHVSWDSDGEIEPDGHQCAICGAVVPLFAGKAHEMYHVMPD